MLVDSSQNNSSGRLTQGIEADSSLKAVVAYIEKYLPIFRTKNQGEIQTAEDTLNDRLSIIFQRYASSVPFFFKAEKIQDPKTGHSSKTDIGVLSDDEKITVCDRTYGENDAFFEIECKRLPTPNTKNIEYVIGQKSPSGGIERFKKKRHGKNLSYSAIIGYVQKENFDYWFSAINSRIDELITNEPNFWYKEDKLYPTSNQSPDFAKYTSENFRDNANGRDCINLLHYWVDLVN